MSNLKVTSHAQQRMSQRGLSYSDIDLAMVIGSEVKDGILVLRRDCESAERQLKLIIQRIRRLSGKRIVIVDGQIVTAYHASSADESRLLRRP